MALTLLEENLNIIQGLADLPNSDDGLDPDELKAKFDEAVNIIKDYINRTLIPEVESDIDAASQGISSGGGIDGEKLVDGSVTGAKLADASISSTKIASKAVTAEKIADKAVSRTQLSEDATTLKTEDFPNKVVPNRALDDAAVTHVKLADGAVVTSKLADGAVVTSKLADEGVTHAKLANDALYSPVVAITANTTISNSHIGKHLLCNSSNNPLEVLIDASSFSALPIGADFAVIRWMFGNFTIRFTGNMIVASETDGILKTTEQASIGFTIPIYGTLAVKKINSAAVLIYGVPEVV